MLCGGAGGLGSGFGLCNFLDVVSVVNVLCLLWPCSMGLILVMGAGMVPACEEYMLAAIRCCVLRYVLVVLFDFWMEIFPLGGR